MEQYDEKRNNRKQEETIFSQAASNIKEKIWT
jgi:hypothetical protein